MESELSTAKELNDRLSERNAEMESFLTEYMGDNTDLKAKIQAMEVEKAEMEAK